VRRADAARADESDFEGPQGFLLFDIASETNYNGSQIIADPQPGNKPGYSDNGNDAG